MTQLSWWNGGWKTEYRAETIQQGAAFGSLYFLPGGMPLKEIKTKPEGGKPKLLDKAAKAPKTAMKDLWLKSKDKSISELKETPFASQRGESSNAPANTAGDQMLSGMETAAKKGASLTYRGGKKAGAGHGPEGKRKKRDFPHPVGGQGCRRQGWESCQKHIF